MVIGGLPHVPLSPLASTAAFIMTFTVSSTAESSHLEFARNKETLSAARLVKTGSNDSEKQSTSAELVTSHKGSKESYGGTPLMKNTSIFTWRNLTYTVKVLGGERVLLEQINGYVKPGTLGALMGSSGAGKVSELAGLLSLVELNVSLGMLQTTLLDVLAQRKTEGEITGQIHVDGRALPLAFQRSAGYCEQLDVHEPLATVREALEFSAILRQPRETSREEKLAYVETIIDLLGMRDIEHALVGKPGAGLGVEHRKRLTIGVELVAKPSILLFLDEPTSGLDSQSAFSIVKFLRKLADVGQASEFCKTPGALN
jgi:ABC-type multidrug transport system ATPase subunit